MKINTITTFVLGLLISINTYAQDQTIVELAQSQEDLSTLVEALKAAELVETLQGEGPFTVFAPTNAAFDALPEGTLETLLKPENKEKLTAVLTYHVASGETASTDLSDGMQVATVEGSDAEVMLQDGAAMIEGAKVVTPDVKASNGIVHIIDAVILPPSMSPASAQGAEESEDSGN